MGRSTLRTAWIGLGSNLASPPAQLVRCLRWLEASPGVALSGVSRLRWTAPVGPPQPDYLNGAARLRTELPPAALLGLLRSLEDAAGRRREVHWGPRTLDLDLLLYEDRVLDGPELILPHPRLHERRFVLEPLCDLDPRQRHPRLDRTMNELLEALT